jgi:hypothetical protein
LSLDTHGYCTQPPRIANDLSSGNAVKQGWIKPEPGLLSKTGT